MDRTAAYYSGPSFHYSGNGGAFGVYSGSRRQRGGGIFGSLARLILPVASSVGKRILRQGARTAIDLTKNVVSDALEGKNVGQSIKAHGKRGLKNLGRYALTQSTGAAENMLGSNPLRKGNAAKRLSPSTRRNTKKKTNRRGGRRAHF